MNTKVPAEASKDASVLIFHAPCAFNPKGVSEETCKATTRVLSRNQGCCSIQCSSSVRACRACLAQTGETHPVKDRIRGLCSFHCEHGEFSKRGGGKPSQPETPRPPLLRKENLARSLVPDLDKVTVRRVLTEPKIIPPSEIIPIVLAKAYVESVGMREESTPSTKRPVSRIEKIKRSKSNDHKLHAHGKSELKRLRNPELTRGRVLEIHVGKRIEQARKTLNMSQGKLGKALGVSHRQVGYYERGLSSIDAGKLYLASRILEVSVEYFYQDLENQTVEADNSPS